MTFAKINLSYPWSLQLDIPWPMERTYLWVSPTSFRLPALSIGMFPSQELDHLFHRHSFFPLYHSILLFFFRLHINEKDKKNYISQKRVGTRHYFHVWWQLELVVSPLNKALKKQVFPPLGSALVWLRRALTLLLSQFSPGWLSLPIIWRVCLCLLHDKLIQSHHMLPYSHHWVVLLFKGS